jgi:two-component system OmpR family response regulator
MSQILLIEDDLKIAEFLIQGLEKDHFFIQHLISGTEALKTLKSRPEISLIILDIMLPDIDGIQLLKSLRSHGVLTPVLILSAKSSVDDRVLGLRAGSDDYLVKPFSFAELLARIEVLLRRFAKESLPVVINFENVTVNLLQRTVFREGKQIELHDKEFLLLELLMKNPSKVFSKKMILENVYGTTLKAQSNLVDVLIFRLRNKFDRPFSKKYIQTIHGLGYSFDSH